MNFKQNFWLFSAFLLLFTCCSDSGNNSGESGLASDPLSEYKMDKAKEILYMIPSPIEVVSLLKKAGAEYKGEFLNPAENVFKIPDNQGACH